MALNYGAGEDFWKSIGLEIKPVNLKGYRAWILIGRTDAEAKTPVFCSCDAKSWLIGKIPDTREDGGQKEKKESEDEIA